MALGWKKDYLRSRELFLKLLLLYRKREDIKKFLELMLSLATVLIFSIFALKPTILTISQLIRDNKVKEESIQKMDTKIKNISLAQNSLQENANKIPIIYSSMPESPSPETVMRQVEGLATLNSVKILGSSFGETTLIGQEKEKGKTKEIFPEGIKGFSFSISATGNYTSLLNFLKNIENLRRPIRVNSVNLSSSNTDIEKVIVILISGDIPFMKGE